MFSPVTAVASSDDDVRSNKGTATHEASTHAPGEHDLVGELPCKKEEKKTPLQSREVFLERTLTSLSIGATDDSTTSAMQGSVL